MTVTEAEEDVLLRDVKGGVPGAHVDHVLVVGLCLRRRLVFVIDHLQVPQIGIENVVNLNFPELLISPLLPWLRSEMWHEAICNNLLSSLGIGLHNLGFQVLDVCETDENLQKLEPLQAVCII